MHFLRSLLIPHHTNTFKPHLIRRHGLALVLVLVLGIQFMADLQATPGQRVLGYASNVTAQGLLAGTNTERTAAGLDSLTLNSQLNSAAQNKAEHMIDKDYWAHTAPDGTTPWFFFDQAGYLYLAAGENLAYGFDTSGGVVAGWMDSPGHRANILMAEYEDVGFGIANGESFQGGPNTVVVALYGDPVSAAPSTAPSVAQSEAPEPAAEPVEDKEEPAAEPTEEAAAPTAENNTPALTLITSASNQPKRITNLEALLSGDAHWSLYGTISLLFVVAFIYAYRHLLFVHNAIIRGEKFVAHHPLLEASLIYIVLGLILSGTHGVIF